MAITTKRRLTNSKYGQESGDILFLSGDTRIFGLLSLLNGNQGNGNVLVSDNNGLFDWEQRGIANGLATLDASQKLVQNIDASKISSGIIDLARIPNSALERLYPVADETSRFNLTINDVQNGDTVKQLDNGIMYLVVDELNLDSSIGYREYNAGRAAAVDWSGVENKPTDITDLSLHNINELENINPNTIIGNNTSSPSSPDEIPVGEQEFVGRLSGENIKGVQAVDIYGVPSSVQTLLSNNSNWDLNNNYTGTTISGVDKGLRYYDSTFVYEFVEENTPVRYLRNPSQVAISNNYFDLDNLPTYQTIVVSNESEFISATETLEGSAGKILFSDDINLSANRVLNLQNVTVDGNKNYIKFNGYKITSDTTKVYFDNVGLFGTKESTNGVDEILNFTAFGGNFTFNRVIFRYLSRGADTSSFDGTSNNIVFSRCANLFIYNSSFNIYAGSGAFPLLINFNPQNTSNDYLHVFFSDIYNTREQCYFGFTGSLAQSGSVFYNDLTFDQSIPLLTGTNFITFPTDSKVFYGRSNFQTLSSTTKSLLENTSNWDGSGNYTGTPITDAKTGLKHYDADYLFEFVTNTTPIRLNRI